MKELNTKLRTAAVAMHLSTLLSAGLMATTTTTFAQAASLPMRLITFNIRYAAVLRDINEQPWTSDLLCGTSKPLNCRAPHVINLLKTKADTEVSSAGGGVALIGLQEVLNNQLLDIKAGLGANWTHIGYGRDDGKTAGEYSPILYRADRLKLVYSEMKWLSPTPDVVSFGWGAGSRRVVTIGVFEDVATGRRFMHANTHLDNVSSQARTEGIKVVVARIKAVRAMYNDDLPVTLTGDFNSEPDGDAHKTLAAMGYLTEVWDSGATRLGSNQLTYTGFTTTGKSRIDYVWFGPTAEKRFAARQFQIMDNYVDGVFMSDHRAVVADLTLL